MAETICNQGFLLENFPAGEIPIDNQRDFSPVGKIAENEGYELYRIYNPDSK